MCVCVSRSRQTDNLDTPAADTTRAAGLPSPNAVGMSNNRESERWYDYEDGGGGSGTPPSARGSRPRSANASDEWYRHDGAAGANQPPPSGVGSSTPTKSRPGRNDDAKRAALAAGGDPNNWYRHDHGSNGADETARTGKRMSTGKDEMTSASSGDDGNPLWFASDGVWHGKGGNDRDTVGKASSFSPK